MTMTKLIPAQEQSFFLISLNEVLIYAAGAAAALGQICRAARGELVSSQD